MAEKYEILKITDSGISSDSGVYASCYIPVEHAGRLLEQPFRQKILNKYGSYIGILIPRYDHKFDNTISEIPQGIVATL